MKRRQPEQEPGFASADTHDEIGDDTSGTRVRRRQPRGSGGGGRGGGSGSGGAWLPWTLLVIVLVGGGLGYFWFVAPIDGQLRQQRAFLAEANTNVATLQKQVETLKTNEANLVAARDALQTTLDQREQALQALQKAQEELSQKLQAEITRSTSQPPPPGRGKRR